MPDFFNFWDTWLSLRFLIPAGLVMAFFVPVALSVLFTWEEGSDE